MQPPYLAVMRYVLRVAIPDRPGALGAVASSLGDAGVDIESLDVIDRVGGIAIDDVCVVTTVGAARLRTLFEAVPGVAVEALDALVEDSQAPTPTALAALLSESRGDVLAQLVAGLPGALGATWAVAVQDGTNGLTALASSSGAPEVPAGLRLPCFPLHGVRRLPQAAWMPDEWRRAGRPEVAAAALHGPYAAVLLGRRGGPRFRAAELQRVAELGRVAVATAQRAGIAELVATP